MYYTLYTVHYKLFTIQYTVYTYTGTPQDLTTEQAHELFNTFCLHTTRDDEGRGGKQNR